MNGNNCPLDQGVLLVLDRDRAKQIFASREPAALREFVETLANDSSQVDAGFVFGLQGHAEMLQRLFVNPSLVSEDLLPVMESALLGGRPLADEEGFQVRLVRPDLVGHIASGLDAIDSSNFADQGSGSDIQPPNLIAQLEAIRQLYRRAAEARAAVVYARVQSHD